MKNLKIFSMLLLTAAAILTSCVGGKELPPVVYPDGLTEYPSGTWDDPIPVSLGSTGTSIPGRAESWVTGYIVGWIDTDAGNQIMFSPTNATATNLVLGPTPDVSTLNDNSPLMSVQLPSGGIRDALNLRDNPGVFGEQVTVKGSLGTTYCGIYGVRSTSAYEFGATGTYEEPIGDGSPVSQLWQDFEASSSISYYTERYWTLVNEAGSLSGWYIKNYSGTNYATVSAYLGSEDGGPYINWLITPAIDMDAMETKTLTFKSQIGYANPTSKLEVYVLSGSADPTAAELAVLNATIPTNSGSAYSAWTDSGVLDLSSFTGTIYIGWRYSSEKGGSDNSATYCIDDINIGDAPEVAPVTKQYSFKKASTIESGSKYLIVGDGNMVANCMTNNYGWMYITKAEPVDGQILLPSTEAAYTFTETDKGWTIVTSKGKKLGIQSGYETVVTNDESTIFWSVVPQTDGSFLITNSSIPGTTATLGYSTQYSSFGAYKSAGKGSNPTLWKLDGEILP